MAKEVDLDDPSTWPDDTAELADMADDMPDDRAGIEKPAEEPETKDSSAEKEPEKEPEKASDKQADDTTSAGSDKSAEDEDPEGVAAKDGKNVLPFSVLQKEREKSHAQAGRIAELEAEAAKLEAGDGGEKKPEINDEGKPEVKAAPPDDDLQKEIESLEADIKSNMEEYGDEKLVSGIKSQIRSLKREQKRIQNQAERDEQRKVDKQVSENALIQDALDNSPILSGWAAADDKTFHEHSTTVHQYLMNTDSDYASKSWAERFKILPKRVEALHGKGPKAADNKVVDIDKAKQDAGKTVPKSISDIQGGEAPAGTDMEELEGMSPSSITEKMMNFKSEDDMEAYVRGLS